MGQAQAVANGGFDTSRALNGDLAELRIWNVARTEIELQAAMGDHLAFMRRLPLSYRSGDVLCVHAGIDPENPDGLDVDTVLWGKARFPETGPVDGLRVVHGHYDAAEPVITDGRICVDTGAYYSGRLTAVRLDNDTGVIVAGT